MTDKEKDKAKVKAAKARAEALSPNERRAIAAKAANARWAKAMPLRATHKGSFQEEFGIDVDCYVLNDPQKSAVISQRGMGAALGMGRLGGRLPRLIRGQMIGSYVGPELTEKFANPLIFQLSSPIPNTQAVTELTVYGYDVTMLIDLCKAIIKADQDGKLVASQKHIARQAQIIVNASAKAGIKGLVYALAGYDATRAEVITAFKLFVRDEAREYEKEFPDQLYNEWYRLYQLPKPQKNKPWRFAHLTIDHVYTPLARSNGKVLELTRARKAASGDRWKKLHQFLSDIGTKTLRTHLGQLLGIAQVSDDRSQYERHIEKIFGKQMALDLDPAR